ncbi:hypothetical protein EOA30_17650 [Mesorhizobium sp. M8A.F.Ca.ET.059.01.1.1]|nr:hypothetical protein EOA30_17650 [Mesorhizobium sp. M8A.F.Ca.ET.059.01.1.1]
MLWPFVLNIVIYLAFIVDFFFGEIANKKFKDALLESYVKIGGSDWKLFYQAPSFILYKIIGKKMLFKSKFGHVVTISIYSIVSTVLLCAFVAVDFSNNAYDFSYHEAFEKLAFTLVPSQLIGNLIAWPVAIYCLRRIAFFDPVYAFFTALGLFAALYAAVALTISLPWLELAWDIQGKNAVNPFWLPVALAIGLYFDSQSLIPILLEPHSFGLQVQFFQMVIPIVLLVLLIALTLVFYFSKGVTKRPLMFLVERIDKYPKSILTLIAAFLSGVAALFAAWMKYSGKG